MISCKKQIEGWIYKQSSQIELFRRRFLDELKAYLVAQGLMTAEKIKTKLLF
jgi:hypothetical protein